MTVVNPKYLVSTNFLRKITKWISWIMGLFGHLDRSYSC